MFALPRFALTLALCLLSAASAYAEPAPEKIVIQDDFKGVRQLMPDGSHKLYPDRATWAFTFWPGIKWPDSYGDGTNWLEGNDDAQTYVSPFLGKVKGKPVPVSLRYDPFSIKEDGLHITASLLTPQQQKAYQVGGHRRFGSGLILSRKTFTYGKVRMVAKLPSARGSWPAFWLLPATPGWPPEIDPLEGMAWGPHAKQIHSGYLTREEERDEFPLAGGWFDLGINPSEGFHEYLLDWNSETVSVSFDGKELWKAPTPPSMKKPMYAIINMAVGGKWPYNELGVKPIDSRAQERLARGSDLIEPDYPADMIIKSFSVIQTK